MGRQPFHAMHLVRRSTRVAPLILLLAVASLACAAASAQPKSEPPNIVLIMTDDQGWGDLSIHGNRQLRTPNMDRLAREGARFDRFFVSPVCAPTRASLLTGRWHLRTGTVSVTRGLETMRSEEVTLAEALRSGGYDTGCFGKWHNGAHYPEHPSGQGFDHFFGFCGGHWNNYFNTTLEENGREVRTEGFITDVLTDAALDWMGRKREQPFFCYIPYNAPHGPFQVPDKYWDRPRTGELDARTRAVYSMVENVDDNIGRILDRLRQSGMDRNTIILFLTDNGPNGSRFNGGMRGAKGSVHEGGVRVALHVRWPGKIPAGREIRPISAHIDLMPTLLGLAGVEPPSGVRFDGVNLAPLLLGQSDALEPRALFTHQSRQLQVRRYPGAVRTQEHRAVNEGQGWMLFDMAADPGQKNDLAMQEPARTAELAQEYEAWFDSLSPTGWERMPVQVGWPESPRITLYAPEAYLDGGVRWFGRSGWAHDWLVGWESPGGRAWWDLAVRCPGTYGVSLLIAAPESARERVVRISSGGRAVEARLPGRLEAPAIAGPDREPRIETFERRWPRVEVGELSLPPGDQTLMVEVAGSGEPLEIKEILLTRRD